MVPEAKARGYKPGRFSFNVKGGRCEACQGDGVIAIEMHFLPDVYVTCEQCKGRRYNRETLEIKYRGKSIADVLDLTVDQALPLLENFPPIANKLRTLQSVGLGYIELGQSATTLSGGEAQRVKLSRELSKRGTGRTLYILDEPTTGLHFEDVRKLLDVLNRLVDQGNTIVVIEHNLDVIKCADWIDRSRARRRRRRGSCRGAGLAGTGGPDAGIAHGPLSGRAVRPAVPPRCVVVFDTVYADGRCGWTATNALSRPDRVVGCKHVDGKRAYVDMMGRLSSRALRFAWAEAALAGAAPTPRAAGSGIRTEWTRNGQYADRFRALGLVFIPATRSR